MKNSNFKTLISAASLVYAGYKGYKVLTRTNKRKDLQGQVVIITGASSGIGKSYAIDFAKEGCKLVLAARSTEKIEELAMELKDKYNTEVIYVTTDVTKDHDAHNLIEKALEKFNKIDILINNAGISTYDYFYKDSIENLKKVMDVNYWGMIHCTHAVLPEMIRRGKGKIVNVSSTAGKIGVPVMANYSATKHAMQGFSNGLRAEVKKHGIDIIVVCPTSTKTDIVLNSSNSKSLKIDPENYFGMSVERVSKETINAILDNKAEHVIGIGENIAITINKLAPAVVNKVLQTSIKYLIKG